VPVTAALAEFSPIYPCLSQGMLGWIPHIGQAYRDHKLHINLELIPNQPQGWRVQDEPEFNPGNIGPSCASLPNPPYSQYGTPAPPLPLDRVLTTGAEGYNKRAAPLFDPTSGFAGTAAERDVLAALAAPVLGTAPDQVPGVTTLMLGPLARGAEVSVR
jgi:phospholipid/cholesterol/gamma-HCH transport system substrate-binding protein